ncbi:AI-2E family transporter [Pseudonocardia sp.]|uniref:AI-2E family transporter n=1 Tax=Pseudonocardia sp. TaxID=60912 RepID=UPI0031FC9242
MTTSAADHPSVPAAGPPAAGPPPTRGIPRALILLLGAASVVVVAGGIRAVAWLIAPAFMALIIVIAVAPVQGRLRRKGWPGWATTLVVVLLVYAILGAIAIGLIVSVARLATELPQYASKADALLSTATANLAKLGVGPEQLAQAKGSLDLGKIAGLLGALLASVAGLASNLVFLLALLLFLSVESGGAGDRLASIARDRPQITAALDHFAWGTRQYLLVTTVFGLIVAVLDSVALALLGVPLAVTWGLLSFITNYIPNVGFVIGVIPPAVLALLQGGPTLALVVVLVYCGINFVVQSIIQPRFIGDAVGLSVTVTFVALVFWAWLLGPLGAILAIPLTLLCKALLVDIDPRARWADAWLRATPKEPAEAAADAAAKAERKQARRRRRTHSDDRAATPEPVAHTAAGQQVGGLGGGVAPPPIPRG